MKNASKFLSLMFCFLLCAPAGYSAPEAAAADVPGSEQGMLKEVMVMDFENGDDLTNRLGGASGSWNMDMLDENNSYTDADVVQIEGLNGEVSGVLKLTYSVDSDVPSQNGFWTKLMSFDATDYDHLEFDVKGDPIKGFTDIFKIEIKKPKPNHEEPKENEESGEAEEVPVPAQTARPVEIEKIKGSFKIHVTDQWERISIPLNKMTGIMDFGDPAVWANPAIARRDLDEFVVVFQDRQVSKKTGAIYIDNLKFVKTDHPGPTAVDFPPRKGEKTPVPLEGVDFAKFLIKRLGGFPEHIVVKKTFPDDPKAFLNVIAEDTWKFFDNIVDQEHGLPLDTIQIGKDATVDESAWVGDYTNVTNIGVYFMCLVSAYDFGFISKEEAIRRIRLTMDTLEKIKYHESGFPYNYYDTTTAEATSYFVSLVDSGWLVAGLYVAKNAFPEELTEQADRLINRGHFDFFYDPVDRQMYHGYYAHLKVYSDYHYGVFYTEPRAISYMAIGRGDVPVEHWFGGMIRTFPEEFGWQQMPPVDRFQKTVRGYSYYGGYYQWKDLKYVPSWGGSAFEALMPTIVLKEKELAPEGLGLNDAMHVQGQIRYAKEELGQPVWGMSPSSVPEGGYSEYGAAPFGSKGYKGGVVTPHAVVLTLEFAPEEAVKNLKELIKRYDIYGDYGFYDAVTVETGLVARKYLALDQAMLFIALNNYLNDGPIRKRFHAEPILKEVEYLLTDEKLFETPQEQPEDELAF